jgi:hypothetical protein
MTLGRVAIGLDVNLARLHLGPTRPARILRSQIPDSERLANLLQNSTQDVRFQISSLLD